MSSIYVAWEDCLETLRGRRLVTYLAICLFTCPQKHETSTACEEKAARASGKPPGTYERCAARARRSLPLAAAGWGGDVWPRGITRGMRGAAQSWAWMVVNSGSLGPGWVPPDILLIRTDRGRYRSIVYRHAMRARVRGTARARGRTTCARTRRATHAPRAPRPCCVLDLPQRDRACAAWPPWAGPPRATIRMQCQ